MFISPLLCPFRAIVRHDSCSQGGAELCPGLICFAPLGHFVRLVCLFLLGLVLTAHVSTVSAEEPLTIISNSTMGTRYTVKIVGVVDSQSIETLIEQRLSQIDARMSTWKEDSEVSRFNRSAANEWFPVSRETAAVVRRAQEISLETQGAFDVTVGPLIRLWNFGADSSNDVNTIPSADEIARIQELVGYGKLEVRDEPPSLRKTVDGLEIDLSAIAKGYAVDEVARVLEENSVSHFLVEIGGEVRVRGKSSGGSAWRIGIEAPIAGERRLHTILSLEASSLASSGDYRNYREIDGRRYSHTIDPSTGWPVDHELAAVTVATPACLSADAHATALLVMGPELANKWCEEHGIAAMLLVRKGMNVIEQRTSRFTLKAHEIAAPKTKNSMSYRGAALVTLLVFTIALFGMAIGVIISKRRLKGSCGGLAGFTDTKGNSICDACTNPSPECRGVESRGEAPRR